MATGSSGVAALLLGVEALATHVQPLMLTAALMGAYVLARQGWMATRDLFELRATRRAAGQAVLIWPTPSRPCCLSGLSAA